MGISFEFMIRLFQKRGKGIVMKQISKFQLNLNLYNMKELLGYEDLQSLKHYTKLTINDLRETHAKFHPRERES